MIVPKPQDIFAFLFGAKVEWAPVLFNILQSQTSPSLSDLKTFPVTQGRIWGIYFKILEHPEQKPCLYVGSATEQKHGVNKRMRNYQTGISIPLRIEKLLHRGYTITFSGLVCWAPIPPPERVPKYRLWLRAIEACITSVLGAADCNSMHHRFVPLRPWQWEGFEYDGLCTHSPLVELVRYLNLSDQELIDLHHAKLEREKLKRRGRDARTGREEIRKYERALAKRNKDTRRHHCEDCNTSFSSKQILASHLDGPGHQRVVSGVWRTEKYVCNLCRRGFTQRNHFNNHNASDVHKERVLAAEKAAEEEDMMLSSDDDEMMDDEE